eukprot:scaffold288702_cov35-Attheya_sp.AAC.1
MLGWVEIEGTTLGVTDGFTLKVGVSLGCEVELGFVAGSDDTDGTGLGLEDGKRLIEGRLLGLFVGDIDSE